jgi:hypothetical protein
MRRNLRISITGIDFDEKQSIDYWPLQQQQQAISASKHRTNERTETIASSFDLPANGEFTGFNDQNDISYRGSNRDQSSHV